MIRRFAQSARTAVEQARSEAADRGDRRIGTEHLLLALLRDEQVAQIMGVNAETGRRAADELDRAALMAIGLEPLGHLHVTTSAPIGRRVPLTPAAKKTLAQTLAYAKAEKARRLTTRQLLLAVLERRAPDPVVPLLAALAIDQNDVRRRLTG